MSYIILVSGGVKSGKSEFAEYLASKEKNVTYIALSENRPAFRSSQLMNFNFFLP